MGQEDATSRPLTKRKPSPKHNRPVWLAAEAPPTSSGQLTSGIRSRRTSDGARDLVRFENVGLRYGLGPEILRDLSFQVPAHSFQFLTGPSGAGKTSLLKLLFLDRKSVV